MSSTSHRMAVLALGFALGCAAPAAAQQTINLTIGAALPEQFAPIAAIKNFVVPEINRRLAVDGKYKINWREAYNGQLFKANASITSLQDGISDMGHVFVAVEGTRLPLAQVSSFTPGVTDDYRLMMRVYNELMETNGPLKAEWDKYNVMFLSAQAPDPVHLFTKFPVRTFEDIKGRKVSGIGSIGSWLTALGGVPISSPLPSMYNDIQTGVSDGAMTVATAVASVKVHEVAPNITLLKMGSFNAGALGISKASYAKLPADVQKVVREVGRAYSDKLAELLDRDVGNAMKLFREEGAKQRPPVVITELSDTERSRMFKSMKNVAQDWAKQVEAGGSPGRQMLVTYMDTMRKHGAKPARDWDRE